MSGVDFVITCIYFYFPAALANGGAVIGKFIPGFRDIQLPVDLGLSYRGMRLVGDHKKMGSFLFGAVFGTMWGVVKYVFLDPSMGEYVFLRLSFAENLGLYGLMAFFAVSGDIVKSIAKRQLGIRAHAAWFPWDEIDHSVCALLTAKLFYNIPWGIIAGSIGSYVIVHLLTNVMAYRLKIKSVPY